MKRFLISLMAAAFSTAALATEIDSYVLAHDAPQPLSNDGGIAALDVYNSTGGGTFTSGANPPRALDDGNFAPGPFGSSSNRRVTNVNSGFSVIGTGNASFDIEVRFWDSLNTGVSPVNTGLLGTYRVAFANLAPGAYQTGLLDITPVFPGGLVFPDADWAVEMVFFNSGTTTLSTRATPLFAGGGVTVGASSDTYWRDANSNGQYDSTDARSFGGGTLLANFYLQMTPEPTSLLLLGFGALALRRR